MIMAANWPHPLNNIAYRAPLLKVLEITRVQVMFLIQGSIIFSFNTGA